MRQKRKNTVELLIVLLLFGGINLLTHWGQKPISLNKGQGWDGLIYFRVAEQFAKGERPFAPAPYVYRMGTPLLVAWLFKDHLFVGFKVVNIVGNFVLTLFLLLWLRRFLPDWKIRLLCLTLFLTQFHAPVRFVYFSPIFTDPWLFVILLTGLLLLHQISTKPSLLWVCLLGGLSLVGVMFREVVLLLSVALFFTTNPLVPQPTLVDTRIRLQTPLTIQWPPLLFVVPLVCALVGLWFVSLIVTQTNRYSFPDTSLFWSYKKPFLAYVHAWFTTYGPILVLLIYHWRRVFHFLFQQQFLLVYVGSFAFLAWNGGSDTERIVFWAMPVMYLLIGKSLQYTPALWQSLPLLLTLGISQAIAQRLFWFIPDYPSWVGTPFPLLTVLSDQCQYHDLWPYHGHESIQGIVLTQYLVLSALLLWLLKRSEICVNR